MGWLQFCASVVVNLVLGRKHGADPPSAIPDKVAAAYREAGAAAGAPRIEEYDVEVRIRGPSMFLEGVGCCGLSVSVGHGLGRFVCICKVQIVV